MRTFLLSFVLTLFAFAGFGQTELFKKGNKVFVEIPNEASRAGELYFLNSLKDWKQWEVVTDEGSADFTIEFNIAKKAMLDKAAWVVIKDKEGKELKKSKTYKSQTTAFNGYNAFKAAAEKVFEKYFQSGEYLK